MASQSAVRHPQSDIGLAMDLDLERFAHPTYTIRKTFFKIFGESFRVFDPEEKLVLFCKLKAFKLKEDIRLYSDEDMQRELLVIKARSVIDFGATYDVVDPVSNENVGSLRRKGLKSILKDEWLILDPAGQEIGKITEDSTFKALVRRFVDMAALLMPQAYTVEASGQKVAEFRQRFNPIVQRLVLDFTPDTQGLLDRRLGVAAGILMAAIEGREG